MAALAVVVAVPAQAQSQGQSQGKRVASSMPDPFAQRRPATIAGNYLALVRNDRIIRAANDEEIAELMTKFEFEKALDYALEKPKAQ